MLDIEATGAIVAKGVLVTREMSIGKLEWRPAGGSPEESPVANRGRIPSRVSAPERWVAFAGERVAHDLITGAERPLPPECAPASTTPMLPMVDQPAITAIDIGDDGTIALVRQGGGFLVRGNTVTPLGLPIHADRQQRFDSAVLGGGVAYAVSSAPNVRPWLVEIDATGGGRAWPDAGITERISRAGQAVVTDRDGSLWVRRFTGGDGVVSFRPANLHAADQGRVAWERVVVRDKNADAHLFTVFDPGRAPRTIRVAPSPSPSWSFVWDLAADGSTLAVADDKRLTVVSLDTGGTIREELMKFSSAIATSRSITAVVDDDGQVRVWACGREAAVDLKKRSDYARSVAISPDERRLAIGTGRGIVIVVEVACAPMR